MSEPRQHPPQPDEQDVPHALVVSECQDRLEVESRIVRRHFWRRLLPGVGITSYAAVSIALGAGTPVVILMAMFGLFTAREAVVFRENLARLRDTELELAALTGTGGGTASAESR